MRRGQTASARSSYERARDAYQQALNLTDTPELHYWVGLAEEKAGNVRDAYGHYRKVTALADGNARFAALAADRLRVVSKAVGLFSPTVEPAGASLTLDGKPVGDVPLTEPIVLLPGTYTFVLSAEGYQPLEGELVILGGSEVRQTYHLEPIPIVFEVPREAPRDMPRADSRPKQPSTAVLWIGAGATLALAGVATTTGILALTRHRVVEDGMRPLGDRQTARSEGKQLSLATDLCLVGTGVVAASTLYYYFGVYRPRLRKAEAAGNWAVSPWIERRSGGIAVTVTY